MKTQLFGESSTGLTESAPTKAQKTPGILKSFRHSLQTKLNKRQLYSENRGLFFYDKLKIAVKEHIWSLPKFLQPHAAYLLTLAGFTNHSNLAYIQIGRPDHVLTGPFKGMKFFPVTTGAEMTPKILGTYEQEIHAAVEEISSGSFDVIVDVGSAEGYYAVGLALRCSPNKVYCYDGNPHAARLLARNATSNNVADRLVSRQWLTPDKLEEILQPAERSLVVCDCEGGEMDVLFPDTTPSLRKTVVLVEIHDQLLDGHIADTLRQRFSSTHKIRRFVSKKREMTDLPPELYLSNEIALDAMDEARVSTMQWFYMIPNN
jgi:predicted O-methyltransferase YrrM